MVRVGCPFYHIFTLDDKTNVRYNAREGGEHKFGKCNLSY